MTETHEVLLRLIKPPNIHVFKMARPTEDVSPRPYCRSRRGRNGLSSETKRSMSRCTVVITVQICMTNELHDHITVNVIHIVIYYNYIHCIVDLEEAHNGLGSETTVPLSVYTVQYTM